MTLEVRISANSHSSVPVLTSIEAHGSIDSIAERLKTILGRYGYDGNLRSISVVIEVPQMEALKASRDAINLAIADVEARNMGRRIGFGRMDGDEDAPHSPTVGTIQQLTDAPPERPMDDGAAETTAALWNAHLANRREPADPLDSSDVRKMLALAEIAKS